MTKEEKIDELLSRGVTEVIDYEHLKKALLKGKTLRVKLGIDPTSPNIHIGRSVSLLKLRDFQDLGCKIVFIVGDFTGVIGDTSDKESERPMLTEEAVKKNMANYVEQAAKILDMDKVEVHYNSEWLKKLDFSEIGNLADKFSVADFIARENIRKRLDEGKRVSLREVLYPLMQGYDSVAVKADVEIGGTDQRFNLLAGRTLQPAYNQPSQDILMTNLILGTDGRKMSSSWGNTINLADDARQMFGKIMSIPDELIVSYFIHCTRIPMDKVNLYEKELAEQKVNPRDLKLELAKTITALYHGEPKAKEEIDYFIETFSQKQTPTDIPEIKMDKDQATVFEILRKAFAENEKSNSEIRRLISQGGVSFDGETKNNEKEIIEIHVEGLTLKAGKLNWFKIKA